MQEEDREDRLNFLGFDQPTREALSKCTPVIESILPEALSTFYEVIRATPEASKFFTDQGHMSRAKGRQQTHWMSIVSGKFDSSYFEGVRKIGLAHSRLGLEPRYYIGGYAHLASALIRAVAKTQASGFIGLRPRHPNLVESQLDALVKAIFLDMELAISLYLEETKANAEDERNQLASEFEKNVGNLVTTLTSVSETIGGASQKVASTVEATLERAVSAASGAEESAASVRAVAAASHQMESATREIAERASSQSDIARKAESLASSAAADIERLNQAASQIGGVVTLIQQIAEQTNLLALNATIESARAGEAGKGFAVVAEEVKTLANQTANATEEIGSEIAAIQAATGTAVEAMSLIKDTISKISETSVGIGAAVEEQASATAEITRSSTSAAEGNEAVASASSDMEKAAREASVSVDVMTSASAEVHTCSSTLADSVGRFLSSIRTSG